MGFNILLRRQLRETILAHSLTHREANHAVDQLAKNSCTLTHTERLTMQLRETILAWILPPAALPIALPAAVTVGGVRRLQKSGLDAADLFPLLFNWLGRHPP
jgi:hypothetical protein